MTRTNCCSSCYIPPEEGEKILAQACSHSCHQTSGTETNPKNMEIEEKIEDAVDAIDGNVKFDFDSPEQHLDFRSEIRWQMKKLLTSDRLSLVEVLEGMKKEPMRLEEEHARQFKKDSDDFKYNPTEYNKTKFLRHESGAEQWRGGMNQGYLKAMNDILTHLQKKVSK